MHSLGGFATSPFDSGHIKWRRPSSTQWNIVGMGGMATQSSSALSVQERLRRAYLTSGRRGRSRRHQHDDLNTPNQGEDARNASDSEN